MVLDLSGATANNMFDARNPTRDAASSRYRNAGTSGLDFAAQLLKKKLRDGKRTSGDHGWY
jgi:hypothetical protein